VHIAVAKKNTSSGSKLKFMRVVGSEVRPASATKNSKTGIIGMSTEQCVNRSVKGQLCRCTID
jgi:hypothetical protein